MASVTLKVPDDMKADWERRADEAGMRSLSEYIRSRMEVSANSSADDQYGVELLSRLSALESELSSVSTRLGRLEGLAEGSY